jgi:NAD(P)-dependent dehydrogenase (short-subunit alcohol dehydrogenase family)
MRPMSKLANKVALVTGGSRGIGAAIAKRLAADGANVAFTYAKDASAASAVVKAIELAGGKAVAIQADAANVEAVRGAVERTVAIVPSRSMGSTLMWRGGLWLRKVGAGRRAAVVTCQAGLASTASSTPVHEASGTPSNPVAIEPHGGLAQG